MGRVFLCTIKKEGISGYLGGMFSFDIEEEELCVYGLCPACIPNAVPHR